MLSILQILPWTSCTAIHYAILREALKETSIGIGNDLDVLIPSHALEKDLVLVTHDAHQEVENLERVSRCRIEYGGLGRIAI